MARFLIVEDSSVILKVLKHVARQTLEEEPWYAMNMAQAVELYQAHQHQLVAALVDLALPDAPHGELVDYLLQQGLPVVVLTGTSDGDVRDQLLKKGVADYVIKESRFSYQYAVQMLQRLEKNRSVEVLIAEDSSTYRHYVRQLLELHQYRVHEAENGAQALEILQQQPAIRLVITDYHMPQLDGFELVQAIRHRFEKRNIAIIGLSGQEDSAISVKFIKNGANDFLSKPFEQEEFVCRVTNNIEALDSLEQLQWQASRDYLTGLYNRRYFSEEGETLLQRAVREQQPLSLAVLDIDFFKNINDEYGHQAGDMVLQQLAQLLEETLGRFLVARTGGEEFSVLLPGLDNDKALSLLNGLRQNVEERIFDIPDDFVRISISAGVAASVALPQPSLSALFARADEHLYRAKEAGRNLVMGDDEDDE